MELTSKDKEIMLKLFKEVNSYYNPSSISKEIDISRIGSYKALKKLEKDNIVKSKRLGKASFYNLNLEDEYARKNIELLLIDEARKKQRWVDEFREIYNYAEIVILFGSIIKHEQNARDIDVLIVMEQKDNKKINELIEEKNKILLKKVHPIKQTREDLVKNIKNNNKVIISAIKEGIVLHGYDKYTDLMKNVRNR